MATFEIKMPKLGESITEGTIMTWSVKVGDTIEEDHVLFEVSTQKVSAEIPSPVAGKILQLLAKEGDTVPVGKVVAIVQLEGDEGTIAEEKPEEEVAPATVAVSAEIKPPKTVPAKAVENKESARWYSPVVLKIAQDEKISQAELDTISGTGYMGRLSKKDIEEFVFQKKKGTATPAAKLADAATADSTPAKQSTAPIQQLPVSGEDKIVEMDPVRRLIADHMVMSKNVSPHVTTVVEADVTNLVRWRDRVKDEFFKHEGIKLTFMPAIVEACTKALIDFPQVNASVDGYRMILKKQINVGIAVALDNGNLIVPVIHQADKLNISGLAASIDSLANKARKNKLVPDDIQGGTFTITNFGTFKNVIGTPIINQPQVAILGVGYIEKKPAVIETPEGDMIAIRHKMYLSLSYDHRIIDGSLGGAFAKRIADYLEAWKVEDNK